MNSDSFFDTDFFQDNKAIITILTTVSLAFFTIYWLYKGLKPEDNSLSQNSQNRNLEFNNLLDNNNQLNNFINSNHLNNQNNFLNSIIPNINNKRRLLINASNVLIQDIENINIGNIYQTLYPLSEIFDLYMLFLIKDNDEIKYITQKMEVLTEDNIIFKHVLSILFFFCYNKI